MMHEKKEIQVSFLIVNYESIVELKQSLHDLNIIIPKNKCEILIANNDSVVLPNTLHKIIPQATQVGIYNLADNRGFGAANNYIAKVAKGNYLFFLNPDTFAFSGSYKKLIREIESEACDVVAPVIQNIDGSPQMWSFGKKVTPWQIILNNLSTKKGNTSISSQDNDLQMTDWVTGAAFLVKKSDFQKIGGFDEKFFLYFEDIDLCKRLGDRGKKIGVSSNMKLKHTSGASAVSKEAQKKNYFAGQSYYLKKHYGTIVAKTFSFIRGLTHPS